MQAYQMHPFTFFSLEHNPVRTPRDLIGKIIATQPTAVILLRALLAKNGIAESQVEVIGMGSAMDQLLTGRVAAVTGWLTDTGALKALGDDRVEMMLWDAGIQLYANVYYTTDDMLSKHADVLTRFLAGSARDGGRSAGTRRPVSTTWWRSTETWIETANWLRSDPCSDSRSMT